MQITEPLLHDKIFHMYNCGINGEDLFKEEENRAYFMELYKRHITPVVDTYAYCLQVITFTLLCG